jgi:tetratricopeptide (TPR) repeat protein
MIERIWELYGEGDFAGARAAIAEKRADEPGWQPTEDLERSLQLGEAALRMRNASDADQYEAVVSIAANMPDLLVCANVDLLWRLAEAFIETNNFQRGIDAYSYVLNNCNDAQERLATLQQATEHLTDEQLAPLLALERLGTDGVGEFEALKLDFARDGVVAVLSGQSPRAQAEDIRRLEASVASTNNPDDLRLLGWYALNQHRPSEGLEWFERAMDEDPSLLSINGLAVALLDLDRPEEAEEALADYEGETEELTELYLSAAAAALAQIPRVELEPRVLERIVAAASINEHVQTAQELGWYALDFNQPRTAIAWFETALGWDSSDEPSAFGIVVASDQLGDDTRVAEIKAQWGGRSARIAEFDTDAAQDESTTSEIGNSNAAAPVRAAAQSEQPQPAISMVETTERAAAAIAPATSITVTYQGCSSYVPPANFSPGQALNRGWCLMDLLRPSEAVEAFARALQSPSSATRSDAAYGQALAYLRMGLAEHASVAAAAAPQPQARVVELQTSILTLTATAAYNAGDYRRALMALDERSLYAVERNDLLVLRAWSYYHLRRYVEAEQIFSAVAATGYGQAIEGMYAARGRLAR